MLSFEKLDYFLLGSSLSGKCGSVVLFSAGHSVQCATNELFLRPYGGTECRDASIISTGVDVETLGVDGGEVEKVFHIAMEAFGNFKAQVGGVRGELLGPGGPVDFAICCQE